MFNFYTFFILFNKILLLNQCMDHYNLEYLQICSSTPMYFGSFVERLCVQNMVACMCVRDVNNDLYDNDLSPKTQKNHLIM